MLGYQRRYIGLRELKTKLRKKKVLHMKKVQRNFTWTGLYIDKCKAGIEFDTATSRVNLLTVYIFT